MTLKKLLKTDYDFTPDQCMQIANYIISHYDLSDILYTYELSDFIDEACVALNIDC